MALFDNGDPEKFLLLIWDFNMTIELTGTLNPGVNTQYVRTPVQGEKSRQFDILSAVVESATPENLASIILGLGTYFFLVNVLPRKSAMRRRMR